MVSAIVVLFLLWGASEWAAYRQYKRRNDEIAILQRENLTLGKALIERGKRQEKDMVTTLEEFAKVWNKCYATATADIDSTEDHEARIAFLENSLTAKPTTAKIVPKSANWKQFRTAAEKATEEQQEPA